MKKIFIFTYLFLFFACPAFSARWGEIFEKKYIDLETITPNYQEKTLTFWTKDLRKNASDKILGKDYWFIMNKWEISCSDKMSRIRSIYIYDLQNNLIYEDTTVPSFNEIVPETYADGYYRLFCLVPFDENPFLK